MLQKETLAGLAEKGRRERIFMDIPVPYSYVFEGERFSSKEPFIGFGCKAGQAVELVLSAKEEDVSDAKIEVQGPDLDVLSKHRADFSLAIMVKVYGKRMEKSFEPLFERHIHRFLNYCYGLIHMGQRDCVCIKISHRAIDAGLRLKDIGIILYRMFHREYANVVDKVEVIFCTDKEAVNRIADQAKAIFKHRDESLSKITDECVDTYYSCSICQSIAPNHVCIVTPERLGLCGAYSWLDAGNSFKMVPSGPNQPVPKGRLLNRKLGQWENVNDCVRKISNHTVERVSMYSLIDSPQTSCGFPECIVAVIPEVKGFMVVHRSYEGVTPCGMNFSELVEFVGRGVQTPGFLGISRNCILSRKFISAEGGLRRLVWISKFLKSEIGERINALALQDGEVNLLEKIADEDDAVDSEKLAGFLKNKGHPALSMPALI